MESIECDSKFLTPAIYGHVLENCRCGADLLNPGWSWAEWRDRSVGKYRNALHHDSATSQSIRLVYGYVCRNRRLKSDNTDSPAPARSPRSCVCRNRWRIPTLSIGKCALRASALSHRTGHIDSGMANRRILRCAISRRV